MPKPLDRIDLNASTSTHQDIKTSPKTDRDIDSIIISMKTIVDIFLRINTFIPFSIYYSICFGLSLTAKVVDVD